MEWYCPEAAEMKQVEAERQRREAAVRQTEVLVVVRRWLEVGVRSC